MATPGQAFEWTTDIEQSILDAIESGQTLSQVANQHGISKALILKHVRLSESFCDQYAQSMAIRTDDDFERLVDLVFDEPERGLKGIDMAWVQLRRLQVDTLKWALSKRNPKKYADRLEHTGADGQPLQLIISVPVPKREELPTIDQKLLDK